MHMQTTATQAAAKKFLDRSITTREIIFLAAVFICLSPLVTPPVALLLGVIMAQVTGHPYIHLNHKATRILLQASVIGLGFGINAGNAAKAGSQGVLFTIASIAITLLLGFIVSRLLKIDRKVSYLISVGTAICGGSAIAAVSPVINAEEKQVSVALGTVFILNAVALFVFPFVGSMLHLSQTQFGLWSAIAIHDTSSVVGAAGKYGNQALETATAVKLARALWIIPVSFLSALLFRNKTGSVKVPWFIGLFIIAMLLNTWVPAIHNCGHYVVTAAKAGLTVTLFLIGSGLSKKVLVTVGYRPFVQGLLLWVIISAITLWTVTSFIH